MTAPVHKVHIAQAATLVVASQPPSLQPRPGQSHLCHRCMEEEEEEDLTAATEVWFDQQLMVLRKLGITSVKDK